MHDFLSRVAALSTGRIKSVYSLHDPCLPLQMLGLLHVLSDHINQQKKKSGSTSSEDLSIPIDSTSPNDSTSTVSDRTSFILRAYAPPPSIAKAARAISPGVVKDFILSYEGSEELVPVLVWDLEFLCEGDDATALARVRTEHVCLTQLPDCRHNCNILHVLILLFATTCTF